jgi:hypothetical protein
LVKFQHQPLNPAPPWGSRPVWQEANRSIDIHIYGYRAEFGPAVTIAREIRSRLASIFPFLDHLCMATCRCCPEPCCLTASPWYDFRDLLFLHLNLIEIPRSQPVDGYKDTCCYLSPPGVRSATNHKALDLYLVPLSHPGGKYEKKESKTVGNYQSNGFRN